MVIETQGGESVGGAHGKNEEGHGRRRDQEFHHKDWEEIGRQVISPAEEYDRTPTLSTCIKQ